MDKFVTTEVKGDIVTLLNGKTLFSPVMFDAQNNMFMYDFQDCNKVWHKDSGNFFYIPYHAVLYVKSNVVAQVGEWIPETEE